MGNKFIERHKRKPLLALLLLLFRGRSKYIALLVIVILFSLPFVATSDMIERFFGLSPVKYMLKFLGLESVVASINPKYSTDIIKATFDRLKQETKGYSLWNKAGLGEEDRGERGTLAFVKVDDEIFKKKEGKNGKTGRDVDIGYSNEKEGGNKEVDLDDIISGKSGDLGLSLNSDLFSKGFGNKFGGGLLGNSGFDGSSAFGKNTFGSYGPFIAKDTFQGSKNNFGVDYKGKGSIGLNALDNIKGNIPDVSNLSLSKKGKVKVSKMGSLTAYGWKNVGYTKKGAVVDVNTSGSRRALFQMGETLATTSMAYKQNPAYEYQAAYTGATYDGNSLNLNIVQTAGDSNTTLPNTGYVSDVIGSAEHWVEIANKCQDAQAVHGTAISKLQDEIDKISKTMTNPPKCCKHGAVSKWNSKVSQLVEKCNQINSHSVSLANECGNSTPQTVNCQSTYGELYIKPCSKWKCWLGIIIEIVGALIGFLIAGPVGAVIGAAIGFAVGTVASIYLQMAAIGAAFAGVGAYFADQKSQKAIEVVEDINKDVAKEK
jgi:hypothetical protein